MTEDLIAMAREAGFARFHDTWAGDQKQVYAFAALIEARAVARTREECAQTAMLVAHNGIETSAAIRALGERT